MSNPYRGEVAIQVDGKDRILRPTFDAIVAWEEATGQTTATLAQMLRDDQARLDLVAKIIVAASADGLSKDELSEEIARRGFNWAFLPTFLLLLNALTGGSNTEGGGQGEAEATDQNQT